MKKMTRKEIKRLVNIGAAVDVTNYSFNQMKEMRDKQYFEQIAYCSGTYGINGALYRGHEDGELYAITSRSTSLYCW